MCRFYEVRSKEEHEEDEVTPYDYHNEEPFEDEVLDEEEQEWCD